MKITNKKERKLVEYWILKIILSYGLDEIKNNLISDYHIQFGYYLKIRNIFVQEKYTDEEHEKFKKIILEKWETVKQYSATSSLNRFKNNTDFIAEKLEFTANEKKVFLFLVMMHKYEYILDTLKIYEELTPDRHIQMLSKLLDIEVEEVQKILSEKGRLYTSELIGLSGFNPIGFKNVSDIYFEDKDTINKIYNKALKDVIARKREIKFCEEFLEIYDEEDLVYLASEAALTMYNENNQIDFMYWIRDNHACAELRIDEEPTPLIVDLDYVDNRGHYEIDEFIEILKKTQTRRLTGVGID